MSTDDISIPCDDEDIQSTMLTQHGGEWPVFLSQIESGTGIKHTLLIDERAAKALCVALSKTVKEIAQADSQ